MDLRIEDSQAERFIELYGHLLAYVNDEFDVLDDVATYDDLKNRSTRDLQSVRQTLYEEDTERLITEFVDANPADLTPDELATIEAWTDFEFGDFVVVRHLKDYAVFLDLEDPPRAFGVNGVWAPFTEFWSEGALPVAVANTVLLPFEDRIVTDTWMGIRQLVFGGNISRDIDDAYEDAKHRYGIVEMLPPPTEEEKSAAEQLQFYMKNKRNRERYHREIMALKEKGGELEQIYHEELGKARARSLGRELRDLDINEAHFAVYDDRIIASGTTAGQVQAVLDEIMPDGKETHPYIYHFNP